MNKTFNINLGGYPFAIDEDAFDYVQEYLSRIRNHFATSDGCEEILYDIEVRMAELFQEHLKGKAIISMKEIDEVIMIMGKPEDFGAEPMTDSYIPSPRTKSSSRINTGKRLFRDPDDKKLGGVCAGIAAYFGIEDPLWIRIIFVLVTVFSGGFLFTLYILLWALVPEAISAGDKLAMRGEPTTINNIAKVVEDEMNELSSKISEWGNEIGSKKKRGGDEARFFAKDALSHGVNALGILVSNIIPIIKNVLRPMVKGIAMIILSGLALIWGASFVGITMGANEIMAFGPQSNFLNKLGFGSLYFSTGIPILGAILLVVRMIFGYRTHKNFRTGMAIAWSLAWCVTIYVASYTIKDFRTQQEKKSLSFHTINQDLIKISMPEESLDKTFGIHLGDFFVENDQKLSIRDVKFSIEKSKDQLVHIEKIVSSRGADVSTALANIGMVQNEPKVIDNQITFSKYFSIPKGARFRDQEVDYVIYIPEGKEFTFDENTREYINPTENLGWDKIWTEDANMTWMMTKDGLFSSDYEDKINHVKKVDMQSFNKLFLNKGFNVVIQKADTPSFTLKGEKDLIEMIEYKDVSGILSITSKENQDFSDVNIIIETNDLNTIHLENAKEVSIIGFDQDKMTLVSKTDTYDTELNFTGNIKDFDVSLDGQQNTSFMGNGEVMSLKLMSGAALKAEKFITKSVNIFGDINHETRLNVSETLKCEDPENLSLSIIGKPKILKLEKEVF
jgi:phage shock protein PspC (stress-responsive transcriptional regulator)